MSDDKADEVIQLSIEKEKTAQALANVRLVEEQVRLAEIEERVRLAEIEKTAQARAQAQAQAWNLGI